MFSVEALRSRLRAANDTAESIQSTAVWIMFYKRHAKEIAEQWREAVEQDANKLAIIYIANEVVQQCKIKRRFEVVDEFSIVLPDAIKAAFETSDEKTKEKIGRVIKVWKQRSVFSPEVLKQIDESTVDSSKELELLVLKFKTLKSMDPHAPGYVEICTETSELLNCLSKEVEKMSEKARANTGEPIERYTAQTAALSISNNGFEQGAIQDDDFAPQYDD